MISGIVPESCRAIVAAYRNEVMQVPSTPEQWKEVARGFEEQWNFSHTLGAIDRKHIHIQNPCFEGTHYFNYKEFYPITLLGVVNTEYKFLYVDVSAIASKSNGGFVSANTQLCKMLDRREANLPAPERLPNETEDKRPPTRPAPIDYFFVGDVAFPLKKYMMKPYPARRLTIPEHIYNYRLSRARRTVKNAFGILANRFSVSHPIKLRHDLVESVVLTACVLHSLIMTRNPHARSEGDEDDLVTREVLPGSWRSGETLPSVTLPQHTATVTGKPQALNVTTFVTM
ncbi:uncharacterized protein [Macrobrachium rosenbergii]|uniref:uncharacterized protein n=1 Tax=Macrobrachium rosenbergii TaxID=79674 RepID=UPI0034D3FF23